MTENENVTDVTNLEIVEESTKTNNVPENFDWDSIGKKHDNYSKEERTKLEEIYNQTLSSVIEHEVIDGTVVAKNNREVVVNIGYKSDGIIPLSELRYNTNLKIGDTVEVYVESQEDTSGQLILSHKKARVLRSWERVNNALTNDEIIQGFVKCRTKGGLIVDVFGIEAFLPGSQIDVKPIRDYDIFVGKTMEFKVVKVNHEYKNVVVSHKALIEAELEQQKTEIISKLEKGQITSFSADKSMNKSTKPNPTKPNQTKPNPTKSQKGELRTLQVLSQIKIKNQRKMQKNMMTKSK